MMKKILLFLSLFCVMSSASAFCAFSMGGLGFRVRVYSHNRLILKTTLESGEQFCTMDGLTESEILLFRICRQTHAFGGTYCAATSYYKLRANTKFGLKVENDQVVLFANGKRVAPFLSFE